MAAFLTKCLVKITFMKFSLYISVQRGRAAFQRRACQQGLPAIPLANLKPMMTDGT